MHLCLRSVYELTICECIYVFADVSISLITNNIKIEYFSGMWNGFHEFFIIPSKKRDGFGSHGTTLALDLIPHSTEMVDEF